jgi:membrane peptidoglycan carboxypeptidase
VKLWRGQSWRRRTAVVAGGSALTLVALTAVGYAMTDVPPPNKVATDQAMTLLYSNNKVMARFGVNRVIVPLDQVSEPAQKAVLAAEDRDFYSEPGISVKGIGRALVTNVKGGEVSQGGSTITQQYAKNAFLTQERTYTRKVKEVFLAVKMTRTVSKDKILEDYLNTIYFGRGAFGIEAAAQTYFGVRAEQLTVAQAAVLASTIRSPARYDPERHPERAEDRWHYVLDGMVQEKWLGAAEAAALKYPKVLTRKQSGGVAPDLTHIRDQVVEELLSHGYSEQRIESGGLTVKTTIDQKAQGAARKAVLEHVKSTGKNPVVAALVAVQPGTGRVVAYYGGRQAGGFDYASDGKGVEPGSSMKPYVLAAALKDGKSLADRYDGSSPQEVCGDRVRNDEGDPPFGRIDLAKALAFSVNTVYTRLACDVGPKKVVDLAHRMGIRTKLDGEGSLSQQVALGSGGYEVHPLDHAVGYATFAAGGEHAAPHFVLSVRDRRGNEILKVRETKDRVLDEDVAADATYAMTRVVAEGTGTRARIPGRPTAGKTGTTQNNKDAWFCGFTPQLATAVWIGRANGTPLGQSGYGGRLAAPLFRDFMADALDGKPVEQFPKPTDRPGATPSATATATASPTPSPSPSAVPTVTVPPVVPTRTKEPNPNPTKTKEPEPTATASAAPVPSQTP